MWSCPWVCTDALLTLLLPTTAPPRHPHLPSQCGYLMASGLNGEGRRACCVFFSLAPQWFQCAVRVDSHEAHHLSLWEWEPFSLQRALRSQWALVCRLQGQGAKCQDHRDGETPAAAIFFSFFSLEHHGSPPCSFNKCQYGPPPPSPPLQSLIDSTGLFFLNAPQGQVRPGSSIGLEACMWLK